MANPAQRPAGTEAETYPNNERQGRWLSFCLMMGICLCAPGEVLAVECSNRPCSRCC